jgi:hypothetical protein
MIEKIRISDFKWPGYDVATLAFFTTVGSEIAIIRMGLAGPVIMMI